MTRPAPRVWPSLLWVPALTYHIWMPCTARVLLWIFKFQLLSNLSCSVCSDDWLRMSSVTPYVVVSDEKAPGAIYFRGRLYFQWLYCVTSHQATELLSVAAVPAQPLMTVTAFYFQQSRPHLQDSGQGHADNGTVKWSGHAAGCVRLVSTFAGFMD